MKKLFNILNYQQKKNFIIQFLMMFIGMFLEIFSIGILFPIIGFMQKGNLSEIKSIINDKFLITLNISDKDILFIIMFFLSLIYIIKMIFLSFFSYKQSKFIYGINSDISIKLYKNYLNQPYIFHLKNNSAHLINNVTFLVDKLTHGLTSLMILCTETITLLGLILLLLFVQPIGTIVVMISLGLLSTLFFYTSKKKVKEWGLLSQYHESMKLKQLQQGLGGIKDVKILGVERNFLKLYKEDILGTSKYNQKQLFLMSLPKLWLEMLAVFGMALLVIIMDRFGNPITAIIPVLGIFAAAAFRLIPSMNRILNALQTVGFSNHSIEKLNEEFGKFTDSKNIELEYPFSGKKFNQINLVDVSFNYPEREKPAIDSVNLKIDFGTSIGFVGTSGAGKSTLIDLILGLLKPKTGSIFVDGFDINKDLASWQKQIGYVPQSIYLTDDTLRNNIAFGIEHDQISEEQIISAVNYAQLNTLVEDMPHGLDTIVGERGVKLSGGQKQRIGIARALYHNPSILVFDEATSALDNSTESSIIEAINFFKNEKTILIIAHRINTLEQCDYICNIEQGKLIDIKRNK